MIDDTIFEPDLADADIMPFSFAVVAGVYGNGLTLKFPGEVATSKRYLCNQYCKFVVGQRVFVVKDSGTYVVICPIGPPNLNVMADSAKTAITAETATYWKNQATGKADMMIYYATRGVIFVKNKADSDNSWTKLTGTSNVTPT